MEKSESKAPFASAFEAFILYFLIPSLLLIFTIQYVELSPNLFLSIEDTVPKEVVSAKLPVEIQPKIPNPINNENTVEQYDQSSNPIQTKTRSSPPKTASLPVEGIDTHINNARQALKNKPNDILSILSLADALNSRDLLYHDGGSTHDEAIQLYSSAVQLILQQREGSLNQKNEIVQRNLNPEIFLDNNSKSLEGLLVHSYCRLAHVYFMANMFEIAVEMYTKALQISPTYLDALNHRGATLLILGKYEKAAKDFDQVIQLDSDRIFCDVFTGMAKVLVAKEDAYPSGWEKIVPTMYTSISSLQQLLQSLSQQQQQLNQDQSTIISYRQYIANNLKHLHLALFSYHDHKTLDLTRAWGNVAKGNYYKLYGHQPYDYSFQQQKIDMIKKVFTPGFWMDGIGSRSKDLIFIIGFVRSGSTLLERILDAHQSIAGTGEDSIFNGRLAMIREAVVEASAGSLSSLQTVVQQQADDVEYFVHERWRKLSQNSTKTKHPLLYVDKMLSNYLNVGFIHMLYPNALILHVSREPMDTLWSAFKHDFPPGDLDYTSDFSSLSHMFKSYRDIMRHWDKVLPGRITHIRYEDMVTDFEGVARAVITATGLPWDDGVLNFHEKKQAVNTLSTTQVRKGIYKESINSWKRYEDQLKPLMNLVGEDAVHSTKTNIK